MRAFTVEIHGMKSVLKNIGAAELGNKAAELEADALDGKACTDEYAVFRDILIEFHQKLNEAIPKKEHAGLPLDTFELALADAVAAATNFDGNQALELLTPFSGGLLENEANDLLDKIISALEIFDCETALQIMIKLELLVIDQYFTRRETYLYRRRITGM